METIVGDNIAAGNANWKFNGDMVHSFEDHVKKSVPLYETGHDLVTKISDFFIKDDSTAYELGSSTGALTNKLANHHKDKHAIFRAIEVEQDMHEKALSLYGKQNNIQFINDDVVGHEYEPADFIVAYYTVQFIRPSQRQDLINKLYASLKWGGAFLLFEKVRAPDARFQDINTALYTDYKIEQGYSTEEIIGKSRSLKGVLEPFSTQGNVELLERAGFKDITTVMKYLCFEGFLAIK